MVKIVLLVNSSRSISIKIEVNPPKPSEMEDETMNPCAIRQELSKVTLESVASVAYLSVITPLSERSNVVLQAVSQLEEGKKSVLVLVRRRRTHDRR